MYKRQIKTLGATHIWYTGIIEHATQTNYTRYGIKPDHPAVVKGKAGSPYAIKDYYDVCLLYTSTGTACSRFSPT